MHLYRARQHPEAFLEVVTVRRRPATRRNEHVEHREAAVGLLTREQHGVGVADNREVDERLVVGTRDRELARRIIGARGDVVLTAGLFICSFLWAIGRCRVVMSFGGLASRPGVGQRPIVNGGDGGAQDAWR